MSTQLEQHYKTCEVAGMLSVHPETIRRAAARGELRSVRVGHERRYPMSAIREWLELLAACGDERPAA